MMGCSAFFMKRPDLDLGTGNPLPDGAPQLSLVIATRGRASLLKRLLDSLACQEGGAEAFEIIVVDNSDAPDPEVQRLCSPGSYPALTLAYTHHPVRGSSGARNQGAALARGRFVGFLDDDASISPAWVRQALAVPAESGAKILGGPYSPTYASPKPAWFKNAYARGEHGSQPGWLGERQYLFAANLVFDRDLFWELGGFSTALGPGTAYPFGEETDLQHRAVRRGERLWYEPGLEIEHHTFPAKMTMGWFLRSSWQKGRAKGRIFREDFTRSYSPPWRLRLGWLRQAIGQLVRIPFLLLQVPFRNRRKYPSYQNFVVERVCPVISNLGLLVELTGSK
jgi:glycosyltransferase involved in cell wall biosynthesis